MEEQDQKFSRKMPSDPILAAKLVECGTVKQTTVFAELVWALRVIGCTRDGESLISLVPVLARHASTESI